ncbi:MAG: hypothetical protein WED09_04800 [Homoserinimonas sp.]
MADAGEFVRATWTIAITVVVIFALLVGVGFWMLRRNARASGASPASGGWRPAQPVKQRANILLVRLDDAVATGEEELSFAIAQFGREVTDEYALVLASARANLTEAFTLQQRLDDAHPDTEARKRDWAARIVHLCETAQSALAAEQARFDDLRGLERNAPANLEDARTLIAALSERRRASAEEVKRLRSSYSASAVASVADNLQRADDALAAATTAADTAEGALGSTSTTAAVDAVRAATDSAHLAAHLLDAIDSLATELAKATEAANALADSTRATLEEARGVRDEPPDPATGAAVAAAIEHASRALSAVPKDDPFRALDELREADAGLDFSLAGARNQRQRLDGARAALAGALVAARSQLSVTRDFISARRGRVGAEARTRLAEAERLLTLAETEADPVLALDTARSSATYSRDADALARYDVR